MSRRQYRGNTQPTTLASPVGLSDTTATLVDGSSFPDGSVGPFALTVDSGAAGEEKWLVTGRTGNNLTGITRGYDSTSAASHSAGASVKHTLSAVDLDEANAHINTTTADDHTQYAKRGQGLAANVGAASRAGRFYIATDSEDLYADDGSTVHRYLSKPSSDAAYQAVNTAALKANNLSDLANLATARANLGALATSGGTLSGALTLSTGSLTLSSGDISASGGLVIGSSAAPSIALAAVFPRSAAEGGLIVRGFASQSANLIAAQDSTPTTRWAITGAGYQFMSASASNPGTPASGGYLWVDSTGALYYKGTSGTARQIAAA